MDARTILRRIALGLPLVVLPIGAGVLITSTGCLCGSCPPGESRTRTLTAAELDALQTDTTNLTCNRLCDASGDGGMADAGADDAGLSSGRFWVCSLEREILHCNENISCGVGRAPSGLRMARAVRGPTRLAAHLAEMAHLEAAAVPAFEELAEALGRHGAPQALVLRARRGAWEERAHARAVGALAEARGAATPAVERDPRPELQSLRALADDNAFEGCVREAYGAVLLAHQAAHATDRRAAATLGAVARDEARHALLSLDVHAWSRAALGGAAARGVEERRARGLDLLRASVAHEPDRAVAATLGLPSATLGRDLVELLASAA